MSKGNKNKADKSAIPEDSKIPSLTARLEAVKGEYQYLQNTKNALHTRSGILIALLSGLVSVAFLRDTDGIIKLFKSNIILAHFRIIFLSALFVAFFVSLISYISTFFTHEYRLFPYSSYTESIQDTLEISNEEVIMEMCKDYADCIEYNEPIFSKMVSHYSFGNKWLLVTIVFTVLTLITTLI